TSPQQNQSASPGQAEPPKGPTALATLREWHGRTPRKSATASLSPPASSCRGYLRKWRAFRESRRSDRQLRVSSGLMTATNDRERRRIAIPARTPRCSALNLDHQNRKLSADKRGSMPNVHCRNPERRMSQRGQTRTSAHVCGTTASPRRADMTG